MNIPALGCEEVPDHLREQASQQDQFGGKPGILDKNLESNIRWRSGDSKLVIVNDHSLN